MSDEKKDGRLKTIGRFACRQAAAGVVQFIAVLGFGVLLCVVLRPFEREVKTEIPGPTITVTVPVLVAGGDDPNAPGPMGWTDDPSQVEAIATTLPFKVFSDTPAGQAQDELPDRAFLWEYATKVLGKPIPTRNQGGVGSCVAFGAAGAVEYLMVLQIAFGAKEEWKEVSQEVIYGGSRVQIGGGQIRGDGSVGAWAAKWLKDYGVVPRGVYPGGIDLTKYSESTCRDYGERGCPKSLEPIAKLRPVREITRVPTTKDALKALASRYPLTIASNVGFGQRGPYVRDRDGVLRASGTWAHQMFVIGYVKHPARGWLFCIMNSWDKDWVSGPAGAGNPPPGSFWCDEPTMQRILSAGDSWAFSSLNGFPLRRLDWFIHNLPAPHERLTIVRRNDPCSSLAF